MPGFDGPSLVARLEERRPGVKALFVSGYADDRVDGASVLLEKPFTIGALARAVRTVLDTGAAGCC
jgi:two-component system cell cycle sensor histidine kinase/response regulator CckA